MWLCKFRQMEENKESRNKNTRTGLVIFDKDCIKFSGE